MLVFAITRTISIPGIAYAIKCAFSYFLNCSRNDYIFKKLVTTECIFTNIFKTIRKNNCSTSRIRSIKPKCLFLYSFKICW